MQKRFLLFLSLLCFFENQIFSNTIIIGVAGGSASGKSTLIDSLKKRLHPSTVTVVQQDDYYCRTRLNEHLKESKIQTYNFDHPDALNFKLMRAHIDNLFNGNSVEHTDYKFHDPNRPDGARMYPADFLIIDGLHVLALPLIREVLHIRFYVHTSEQVRLDRRIERDFRVRGVKEESTRTQYHTTVKPMHDIFVEPSKQHANFIIPGDGDIDEQVSKMIQIIRTYLQKKDSVSHSAGLRARL